MSNAHDALHDLRAALVDVIAETVGSLDAHAELFADTPRRLREARPAASGTPVSLPVVEQWLNQCLDQAAAAGPLGSLVECLRVAAPELAWRQAYDWLPSTPELEAYRAHYAWTPIALPASDDEAGPFDAGDLLAGFTIQAPHVLYPHHHHRAPELYGVIGGAIDWQVGTSPWTTRTAGDAIVHRSNESHSMRTDDEPGLTWALWPSDVDSTVYMPSLDPPDQTTEPTVYP